MKDSVEGVAVITLRQPQTQQRKKVVWTEDTIDNEHMNKKKSKCCCIYGKPHKFGESDSEDSDDECEHCFGHVEQRQAKLQENAAITITEEAPHAEQTATIALHPSEPAPAAPPDIQEQ